MDKIAGASGMTSVKENKKHSPFSRIRFAREPELCIMGKHPLKQKY